MRAGKINTDLNRLHDVVSGKINGRRSGRTYAACHELAGIIEASTHDDKMVWLLPYHHRILYVVPMIKRVLSEHNIKS